MEPKIYKTGEYKTPGVYKGAGGIYNGRGVYNDVGNYSSPFILLNNCDNLEDNICKSLIGSDLQTYPNPDSFGYLVNSQVYAGTKSIRRNNTLYTRIKNITTEDIFTIEISAGSLSGGVLDFYALKWLCIQTNAYGYYNFMIGGVDAYDFNTTYPVLNWSSNLKAVSIPYKAQFHIAAVIDKTDSNKITLFVDGDLIGSYHCPYPIGDEIAQNGSGADSIIEFYAIRNGDFSNNLQSFTVPIEKYSL